MRTRLTIWTLDLPVQILGSGLDKESSGQGDTAAGAEFPAGPGLWGPKLQGRGLKPLAQDATYKGSWVDCERDCPMTEVPGCQHQWMPSPVLSVPSPVQTLAYGYRKVLSALSFVLCSQLYSQHLQRGTQREPQERLVARMSLCAQVCEPHRCAHSTPHTPPLFSLLEGT